MAITDNVPLLPEPVLPPDVQADIVEWAEDEDFLTMRRRLRMTLSGGEVVLVLDPTPRRVVETVRKVQENRAQAELERMYTEAGWVTKQVTECACCGTYAPGGCVLPPKAKITPATVCKGAFLMGSCCCYGGSTGYCEDCTLARAQAPSILTE